VRTESYTSHTVYVSSGACLTRVKEDRWNLAKVCTLLCALLILFIHTNQIKCISINQSLVKRHKSPANRWRVKRKARPSGYRKLWQKVPSLKHVSQSWLIDNYNGSEFHTEGELISRLKDFADIVRDIRGIVSSSLLEDRNVLVGRPM